LGQDATDEQRIDNIANRKLAHNVLVKFFSSLRCESSSDWTDRHLQW
jgi:hypothetical protein